jgi:hypothetical protein
MFIFTGLRSLFHLIELVGVICFAKNVLIYSGSRDVSSNVFTHNWRTEFGVKLDSHFEERHRLRTFENRVLRGIFGPERGEVTGEWRMLHIGELHNFYPSPDIIRVIKSRKLNGQGM